MGALARSITHRLTSAVTRALTDVEGAGMFDAFGFVAPRRSSVALTKGAGAFSFTRATTATVEDWEGAIRACKSGEVRFPGARRVENLIATTSEDFTNAAWIKNAATAAIVGGVSRITATATTASYATHSVPISGTPANKVFRVTAKLRGSKNGIAGLPHFPAAPNDFTHLPTATYFPITTEWGVYTSDVAIIGATASASLAVGVYLSAGSATFTTIGDWIEVEWIQLEDITGQSNQNPSEYVPVGAEKLNYARQTDSVLTTPWTAANFVARAEAPVICDGAVLRPVETVAGIASAIVQSVVAFPASTLTYTVYAKKGSGATDLNRFGVYNTTTAAYVCLITFNYDTGVAIDNVGSGTVVEDRGDGVWKIVMNASAGITAGNNLNFYVGCAGAVETAGEWAYLGGVMLSQGLTPPAAHFPVGNVYPFHGACVDGVRYVEHQNGNTVASNVVTEAMGATLTTCKGQLDETASTNLVLQSSNFGTTWAAVGSPTRSAAAAYCGSIALDLIGDDDAGNLEGYTQTITFTGNAAKSVSFLVKQGSSTSTVVRLRDTTAGADRLLVAITWSAGVPVATYTTGSSERASKSLGGGVFRVFALTASVTAANTNSLQVYPAADAALAVGMAGNIYCGGVQAENASTASSHIPTTTGPVTRNADTGSYPSAGNVSANGGTLYVEYEIERDTGADQVLAEIGDSSSNERITFYRGAAGGITVYVTDGGVAQCVLNLGAAAVGSSGRIAVRWAANDFAGVMTGGAIQTDVSGTLPAITTIYPGNGRGSYQAQGPTKNLRISQSLLSDSELLALVK